jgi:ferrous iron transport protein A
MALRAIKAPLPGSLVIVCKARAAQFVEIVSMLDGSREADREENSEALPLSLRRKPWRGRVVALTPVETGGVPWSELERRLLEMGFVEGARLEILHEGPVRRDPIAVRVDDCTIAIRRRDAAAIVCQEDRV